MEFIWGENIFFLNYSIHLCQRSLILECKNNFFRKFHSLPRESTGASKIYGDHALRWSLVLQMSNKEDFKDFKTMTEKTDFFTQ